MACGGSERRRRTLAGKNVGKEQAPLEKSGALSFRDAGTLIAHLPGISSQSLGKMMRPSTFALIFSFFRDLHNLSGEEHLEAGARYRLSDHNREDNRKNP